MVGRDELLAWCAQALNVAAFKDYAPNGLQVEGGHTVRRIVAAVTASKAAIDYAVAEGADMLLVHHGMFWKSEPVPLVGWKRQRIAALLAHNINLVGYHLPLDAHPEWGNNAQLAALMGWETEYTCGEQGLLSVGIWPQGGTLADLTAQLYGKLARAPVAAGDMGRTIRRLAWCTGGAQGWFQTALEQGVDAYVTGEISEAQFHLANETGVAFVSAGHHATERYGVQALAAALAAQFGVETVFFDEQNPA
ncbi:Nif3-like dinuclear metal center hexameric protein [Neisseria leonii]|uniref:Nif3-like dinuclear metal center hexameric protein n=1 Tax=Neisseria leonii TaxID=2995413 RepID=A0A9X4E4E7_9NEIS|nr:Nif3-like dinuclear metal center hexameric protein [Neisseria sp. 51.81]MDD9328534.1 Nif3-like dinuclear metal center hexameric protein [Neisseria sp. 51.81]